jgi:methionyl-tRNA formyltransferase
MAVLLLSPYPHGIIDALADKGDLVTIVEQPLDLAGAQKRNAEWIVSYGYRHILREPLLSAYAKRIINLHIGYLPWGRGADANLWSWIEGTPKGVTIHEVDAGIDTGPIIVQRHVEFPSSETLATSYQRLRETVEALFAEFWSVIRSGSIVSFPQPTGGSYHRASQGRAILDSLPLRYDTPVSALRKFHA